MNPNFGLFGHRWHMVLHKRSKRPLRDYLLCVCVDTAINISLLISLNVLCFKWVKVQNCYNIEKIKSKRKLLKKDSVCTCKMKKISALKWKNTKVIPKVLFTRNVCVCSFDRCQEWGLWEQVIVFIITFAFSRIGWQRSKKNTNADVTCEWTLSIKLNANISTRKEHWLKIFTPNN